jgi:hypothetical protein
MDDAGAMRLVECARNLNGDRQRLVERQSLRGQSGEPGSDGFALQVLHDEIGDSTLFADVVKRADVWVIE